MVLVAGLLLGAGLTSGAPAAKELDQIELSPVVTRLLDDPVTSDAERQAMAVFHGQWARVANPTVAQRAMVALGRFELGESVLLDEGVPALVRAEGALWRGEPEQAVQWLVDDPSLQAAVVAARAYRDLGAVREAVGVLEPWRERLQSQELTGAASLTAAGEALAMLAQLEGRPARDYGLAMSLFGKARVEADPLYWPAYLAEARLLIDKDNNPQAAQALFEALTLNPSCGEAWYLLGRMLLGAFDFDRAGVCLKKLREINEQHLLADALEARLLLTQKDAGQARAVIEAALSRYPRQRELVALLAAAEALLFDRAAVDAALGHFEQLAPRHPLAYYTVGEYLAAARQYAWGEAVLRRAIELDPNWAQPRVELGTLLMQWGKEQAALVELRHATRLDSFNRQAHNQAKLAEELVGYEQIRTEHFVIKYQAGVDGVLARDMPEELERIYGHLTAVFGYEPPNPTLIEIMPDEERFAVRITGMPDIWTIAACTGDVIAMTPPRGGAHQHGSFDWVRVIQHEFVHTVTLNQTDYRIPHWFTEGCAVSQEPVDRGYDECRLLAKSFNRLFGLDQISWAFIRPESPLDRPLAYAQASWMVQYVTERFGHRAVVAMLERYREGATEAQAILTATGQAPDFFMAGFKAWAAKEMRSWGLGPQLGDDEIKKAFGPSDKPSDEVLAQWLERYPSHPGLLRMAAGRAVERAVRRDDELGVGGANAVELEAVKQVVLRYAASRPVDPWSDEQLVRIAKRQGRVEEAIGAMQQLDRADDKTGRWAVELAGIHRDAGRLGLAADAMTRALQRQPYNASYRELAATVALQGGDFEGALRHLQAMVALEPDRAIHQVRLAAIYAKMGRREESVSAAQAAMRLDPAAPVDALLERGGQSGSP